ncbi:MAG: hypothetical protein WBD27_00085 [Pyrinomonadaceae bacterium]
MPKPKQNLGKLISTHGTSPAYLQRAAIIAVLSFVFFLAMLVAFYVRQHIGYFALSTAFLIVYVLTLISWVIQKRSLVSIYENGLGYKKFSGLWDEIEAEIIVEESAGRKHIKLRKSKRENVIIPSSIQGFDRILGVVIEKTVS